MNVKPIVIVKTDADCNSGSGGAHYRYGGGAVVLVRSTERQITRVANLWTESTAFDCYAM